MLTRTLRPLEELAFELLRLVSGLMFSFHGAQKVLGIFGAAQPPVGSQLWVGGLIELLGGGLVALGLWTTPAAFVASGTMAVAYAQFHWKLDLGVKFFPAMNKGELAVLYCLVFFFIACRGTGRFGVEGRKKAR